MKIALFIVALLSITVDIVIGLGVFDKHLLAQRKARL
jgi:hypothetical protein